VNANHTLDFSKKDMSMVHYPQWKHQQKQNWVTANGFKNLLGKVPMGKSSWGTIPIREDVEDFNPYNGGNYEVGCKSISKLRKPEKESDQINQFISFGRTDIWDSTLKISQSTRTKINDKVLHLIPVHDNFSSNNHLEYYKQNLVDTKNVDRIIPFKHSNNFKGEAMNNLRPISKKLYPKTSQE